MSVSIYKTSWYASLHEAGSICVLKGKIRVVSVDWRATIKFRTFFRCLAMLIIFFHRSAACLLMVDECQKSLEPIFFTVHTFVKTDFKGNCAKKSTLWLLICCKKLSLDSQDKQSMEKIRWNRQAYGIKGGWGTHIRKQNKILAFTGPDPRGGLWVFSRTSRWV